MGALQVENRTLREELERLGSEYENFKMLSIASTVETAVDLVIAQLKSANTGLPSRASETVEILVWVNMVLQTG